MTTQLLPPPAAPAHPSPPSPPAPPVDGGGRGSGGRRVAIALLGVVAALTIAWGAFALTDLASYRSQTSQFTVGAASSLRIQTDGDIRVTGSNPGDPIQVTRTVSYGLREPTYGGGTDGATSADGELLLTGSCPAVLSTRCSVTYEVTLPPDTELLLDTDQGAIRVVGIDGDVTAHSDAGSVVFQDLSGAVQATSDAGYVRGEGLTSSNVTATSDAGSVRLFFDRSPTTVVAKSDAGRVEVVVPDDGTVYAVDASTDAGKTNVIVATDPTSTNTIHARSDAGSVTVHYPD